MMELEQYEFLRGLSSALCNNMVVLPVAWAVRDLTDGTAFGAREIRERLAGRMEANQIREGLDRLARIGAVQELPYPGRPLARNWVLLESPFWPFLEAWVERAAEPAQG